jgi:hypothetical protein
MITKFDKFNLIKESPDTVWYKDNWNYYTDDDAMPFFITINKNNEVRKLYMAKNKTGIAHRYIPNKNFFGINRDQPRDKAYPGRIWLDRKVMSFWVYPDEKLFISIINNLEKKLKIKMFNNDWYIEVYKLDSGDIKKRDKNNTDYYCYDNDELSGRKEFIPIDEYAGSEDAPEEERIAHLMNWQEKEKLKKEKGVKGFGSGKTAWDKPHNIKWRQAIYQENKNNN